MNELDLAIKEMKETRQDMRDNRRSIRESLWEARQALKDPTLTIDERDFWEENAFKNAQLLEQVEENIAEADETI